MEFGGLKSGTGETRGKGPTENHILISSFALHACLSREIMTTIVTLANSEVGNKAGRSAEYGVQ